MAFILFMAAIIVLGIETIKLKRKNRERFNKALDELLHADETEKPEESVSEKKNGGHTYFIPPKLETEGLVIPDNFILKEEFEILLYMAKKYPDETDIDLYKPVSADALRLFERSSGIWLTDELKALYSFTNGLIVNNGTLVLDCLENIEADHKTGYCDWVKSGDAMDYLLIGSVIGDGQYIAMEKRTGRILWYDHGKMTDYGTIANLLNWIIEFIYSDYSDDDEKIENYLKKH